MIFMCVSIEILIFSLFGTNEKGPKLSKKNYTLPTNRDINKKQQKNVEKHKKQEKLSLDWQFREQFTYFHFFKNLKMRSFDIRL